MTEKDLRDALTTAMRAKDAARLRALRAVLALVKNRMIEVKGELAERDIAALIQREVKQCKETLEFARQAGRDDQVAEHEEQLAILEGLLPSALSSDELASAIRDIVKETGATSLGPIMKALG
ncbi:MAG: GatB/YqeY domain-containing protein, partial [Candidatus Binatia bacterium]